MPERSSGVAWHSLRVRLPLIAVAAGVGIAPEDLGKLFVEFQQLDASLAKRYQGTGLGLALTKRLVEAQGGRVEVRSTLGTGSTLSAILPRLMPTADPDRAREPAASLVSRGTHGG